MMKRWFWRKERDGFVGLERERGREGKRDLGVGVTMGDGEKKERGNGI